MARKHEIYRRKFLLRSDLPFQESTIIISSLRLNNKINAPAKRFENTRALPQRVKARSVSGFALLSLRSRNHARSAFKRFSRRLASADNIFKSERRMALKIRRGARRFPKISSNHRIGNDYSVKTCRRFSRTTYVPVSLFRRTALSPSGRRAGWNQKEAENGRQKEPGRFSCRSRNGSGKRP